MLLSQIIGKTEPLSLSEAYLAAWGGWAAALLKNGVQ